MTASAVEVARSMTAVVVPLRWLNHHRDICAIVTADEVRWIMRDVALAVYGEAREFAGDAGHEPNLRDHGAAIAWPISTAGRWVSQQASAMENHGELLQWLEDQEAGLYRQGLANVVRLTSPIEVVVDVDGNPAAVPSLYSVKQAAEILDRDPGILTGQHRLFDSLLRNGWTIRAGDTHRPTQEAVRLGYLDVTRRRIPVQDELYPQVVLTHDGIRALHKLLGGQAAIQFTAPTPTPVLEDLQ